MCGFKMAAPNLRHMAFFTAAATTLVVILFAGGLQCADAEPVTANLNLRDCDPDNNGYYPSPSPSNCPTIITVIPNGGTVYPICSYQGSSVNGDSWWLYVAYGAYKRGFVADYYVDCGGVVCPYALCSNPL